MTEKEILDALNYIGVDPDDFDLKDSYFTSDYFAHHRHHGKGHLYRVMIGAALIAHRLHEPRIGKLAFCAAFLHDQARINNGGDYSHGLRAAQKCFDKFNSIWDKYEISPYERQYIRSACADHSGNSGHTYLKNREVRNILKDADALDRCRFYNHGKLNPSMLSHQKVSVGLIKSIEEICSNTNISFNNEIGFREFIRKATTPVIKLQANYNRGYAPDIIQNLEADQIFVFNNNGKGNSTFRTAIAARKYHGAQKGVAEGLTGASYSIPTEGGLSDIKNRVDTFINFAKANPNLEFLLTKIGCGGANYSPADIAPMFKKALAIDNILLPKEFVDIIK